MSKLEKFQAARRASLLAINDYMDAVEEAIKKDQLTYKDREVLIARLQAADQSLLLDQMCQELVDRTEARIQAAAEKVFPEYCP